ncbi:MAG: DegV family protein [Clostridiales bacterium]|nr:DegV family protein [Clostridiales bacterium]
MVLLAVAKMIFSTACPKSSCPSPEAYKNSYKADVDRVYVVTLSAPLSGSYNSAVVGKNMYIEEFGPKNIYVCDSRSASIGEAQIALLAMELEKENLSFEQIVEKLEAYRDELKTYFVLDNLDTLRKNGRLTGVKALVASTLSIKPVMGANKEGNILQLGQAIGINKALAKMVDHIVKDVKDTAKKRLMISHCNCKERAEYVKKLLLEKAEFREILILDTRGISSMYANDGGIIVTI